MASDRHGGPWVLVCGAAVAASLAVLLVACGHSATAPTTAATTPLGVASISISGPPSVVPGGSASFIATATMTDGTKQDYTRKVSWTAYPASIMTIGRDTGEAIAHEAGDANVWANLCCVPTPRLVVPVLPPNTYRLIGKVLESGLPLQGAVVEVTSGIGAGLSATTEYDGGYRLYGVAGAVQLRVRKSGYADLVRTVTVSSNDVVDFPDARQSGPTPQLAGNYTLTMTADSGCPTEPSPRSAPPLPADMRQRTYAAVLAQDGPVITVTLIGGQFSPPTNRISGRVEPDGIKFEIGDGYFGYGPDDGLTERLSATLALTFEGVMQGTRSGSTLIGSLNGAIDLYETVPFTHAAGECTASNHRFTMTARTGTAP